MISRVAAWIRAAERVTVLTGAGISAESGVPVFRGSGGLWRQFRPEELATPEAFERQPELVWEWYLWRRGKIAAAQPNPGHAVIARWESQGGRGDPGDRLRQERQGDQGGQGGRTRQGDLERPTLPGLSVRSDLPDLPDLPAFTLLTQTVDGLHARAGSINPVELHGNLWRVGCAARCGYVALDVESDPPRDRLRCECGAWLRPEVVWFGESLDPDVLATAAHAVESADVVLVVGTSAVVYPVAGLPELARRRGAHVVEVNVEETPLSADVDAVLRGPAGEILPALERAL